jgi:hypothetical protein
MISPESYPADAFKMISPASYPADEFKNVPQTVNLHLNLLVLVRRYKRQEAFAE